MSLHVKNVTNIGKEFLDIELRGVKTDLGGTSIQPMASGWKFVRGLCLWIEPMYNTIS
jgi:hypothetical protein